MTRLHGNLDFFLMRASQGPFRLKHKTQGPSHIHIPKGKLLLRCLWKDGLPLHSKTGNQLSSPDDMPCPGFSSCCFTEIDVPIDLRWVSPGVSWERQLPLSRGQGAHQWASAAPGPLAEDERGCQASPGPSGRWGPLWKMSGRGLPGRQVFSRNSQHFTAKATCLQNHDSCQRASEALTPLVCLEAAHPL